MSDELVIKDDDEMQSVCYCGKVNANHWIVQTAGGWMCDDSR